MSKKLGSVIALLLVALLVAACGGGGSEEPTSTSSSSSSGGSQTIEVSGTDFAFSPADLTVKRGESVEIVFKNDGRVQHDMVIQGINGADSGKVTAGQSATFSFTPNASGEYKIVCTEPGHEASGMVGTLTVE